MAAAGVFFNAGIRGQPFPGLLYGATAVFVALLGWLVTVLWNNAHDLEIDRIAGGTGLSFAVGRRRTSTSGSAGRWPSSPFSRAASSGPRPS